MRCCILAAILTAGSAAYADTYDDLCNDAISREYHPAPAQALDVCVDVAEAAEAGGVDVRLAISVAWVESRFYPRASSSHGAVGPLQVLPQYHCDNRQSCSYQESIDAGIALLVYLLRRHETHDALRAYSCGETGAARGPDYCLSYATTVHELAVSLGMYGC